MHEHDTATVVAHESGSAGSGLFSIDPGLSIWTWVVFGLLFIVLRKYAWRPMMDSVKEREQTMAKAVEEAKKTREALEQIAAKQEAAFQEAREEARRIIDDGRKTAEAASQSINEKAVQEAKRTLDDARKQIGDEKERVLSEIRKQSVDLIINASEKLITVSLDDEAHRKIVVRQLEDR